MEPLDGYKLQEKKLESNLIWQKKSNTHNGSLPSLSLPGVRKGGGGLHYFFLTGNDSSCNYLPFDHIQLLYRRSQPV